jgi:hypothetical protein
MRSTGQLMIKRQHSQSTRGSKEGDSTVFSDRYGFPE